MIKTVTVGVTVFLPLEFNVTIDEIRILQYNVACNVGKKMSLLKELVFFFKMTVRDGTNKYGAVQYGDASGINSINNSLFILSY